MLQIYNTLTRQKEEFKPIKPGYVGMYVCGLTVYDYCHVGHGRLFVVFDVIRRYLLARDYKVKFICNITDIDDKIIKRANENKEEYTAFTERFIASSYEDLAKLNVLPPDVQPRATEFIQPIINMIETLIKKGFAYVGATGDVYFEVKKFRTYGELAHQDLENLRSGIRIDVVEAKHDPLDFVLWKMAKPGEPSWDSPWGKGRPGWHIECSAMAEQELSPHFDIHGGGVDLQFPHHQNELAQSEAAHSEKFVNVWMHNGLVQVNKEKMSKSLGNFFILRDVFQKHAPEVVRYFLLASHYRSPINYSDENLQSAKQALLRFYTVLRDFPGLIAAANHSEYSQKFFTAMDDDFNTPEALAAMFDLTREINRLKVAGEIQTATKQAAELLYLGNILGILINDPKELLQGELGDLTAEEIEAKIAERNQARAEKNYAQADKVRDELLKQGVVLEDAAGKTIWRKS